MSLKSFISDLYTVKNSKSFSIDDVYQRLGYGKKTAGVIVNTSTSMTHSTVYACVRDKSESVGQLPLKLYRTLSDGTREEVKKGREHRIFTKRPNSFMTQQDFLMMYMTCRELYGRFFAYAVRNDRGSISEIIPFRYQTNITVDMDLNGEVYYTYVTNDNKPAIRFANEDIMHIKLNTLDGFTGMSPISHNADAIGLGMAQERHLSSLMKNGAMPKGLLETDLVFADPKNATRLREEFDDRYAGADKSGKTVLLENGIKFRPLTISPVDAELLSSRQYSQQQICGIFRVPPRRIGVIASSGSSDIEQENKDYYVNSLMPAVTAYEDAINSMLPDNLTVQVDERGFVRGDLESQVKGMGEAFKLTAISIDEFREGIGMQPIENGHLHAIDTNNITLETLDQVEKLQEEQRALALAGAQRSQEPNLEQEDDEDAN